MIMIYDMIYDICITPFLCEYKSNHLIPINITFVHKVHACIFVHRTEESFVLFIRMLLVLKTLDLSVSGNHIIFPWFKERENGVSGWVGPSVHTKKVGRRHL